MHQSYIIARRILIGTWLASTICTENVFAQERLFGGNAAWTSAYRALVPKDGNELKRFVPRSSLPSLLDSALAESNYAREQSPLVRAIFQRAAWRAFDSLAADSAYADAKNQGLRQRLAKIISVTALTSDEVERLRNTYVGRALGDDIERNPAFDLDLPNDLFDKDGHWLQLTYQGLSRIGLTHEKSRNWRSEFLLFVLFPEGRQQGEEFLKKHNVFAKHQGQKRQAILNFQPSRNGSTPDMPTMPKGVRAILVERMLVITTDYIPVSTPIITSLAAIELTPILNPENSRVHPIRSAAFEIDFESLINPEEEVSLRRLGDHEPFSGEFRFQTGNQMCSTCHSGNGLLSFSGGVFGIVVPDFRTVDVVPNGTPSATATWKKREFSFGLLRGILESLDGPDTAGT